MTTTDRLLAQRLGTLMVGIVLAAIGAAVLARSDAAWLEAFSLVPLGAGMLSAGYALGRLAGDAEQGSYSE